MTTVPSMVSQQLGLLSSGADPADVRAGQSFIKPGSLAIQSGTMTDNGDLGTIVPKATDVPIPEGYTTGGVVQGDADLVPSNIKAGTDIFGVTGTAVLASGNAVNANVLAGVTYSSASGTGVGTMPNNGSLGIIIPDTTSKTIPAGYTTGGSVAGSINLIPSNIRSGTSIYGVTGSVIQASGSATADKLLLGETASTASGVITGTMPNNGTLGTITPGTTSKPIPLGYTSGGTVAGSGNLQAGNIRLGVNIFGITGSLDPGTQTGGTANPDDVLAGETFTNDSGVQTGSMVNNGAVNITPSNTSQVIPLGYHNGGGQVNPVSFDTSKVLSGTTIAGTAGTMVNNGDLGTFTPGIDTQSIPPGYTSGGTVAGDVDLVPGNIKNGVNIFGVEGTLENTVITGQLQQPVVYAESIAANDPIYLKYTGVNNSTISVSGYPTSVARGINLSTDKVYMAAVQNTSPFLNIYKLTADVYTRLVNPVTLPTGNSYFVSFSLDGTYMAVAHEISPFVTIYKRSGDTFTKLSNPSVLPTATAYAVSFSPDGAYLAVAHATSPFVTIYKRSGDTFTKLSNPSVLPTSTAYSVSFSPDGTKLVVTHENGSNVTIYNRSGDTFTKVSDPTSLPPSTGLGSSFRPDGKYLAISLQSAPYFMVYKITGDIFTKINDPTSLPTGSGASLAFSPDNSTLVVPHSTSPFVTIYKQTGDVLTKMDNPATLPTGSGTGVALANNYFAVSHAGSPYITMYGEITSKAFKSTNNIVDVQQSNSLGYALSSGIAGDTKDAIIIWR